MVLLFGFGLTSGRRRSYVIIGFMLTLFGFPLSHAAPNGDAPQDPFSPIPQNPRNQQNNYNCGDGQCMVHHAIFRSENRSACI
jgi:hypothetical protein